MKVPLSYWVTRVGGHLTKKQVVNMKGALRYLEAGFLMRRLGYRLGRIETFAKNREELFDLVSREVGNMKVLYLEFGARQGDTILHWSKLLSNSESTLYGFNSFGGLPETWNNQHPKGHISTDGVIPILDDPRVQFVKGRLDQSLPGCRIQEHEALVLNFDADLHSSTLFVLNYLSPWIIPGTFLYFDDFVAARYKLRAFDEFTSSGKQTFALRGATKTLSSVLFQCIE